MDEMAPLLPILLVWLCFGFLYRRLQAAGKKAKSANQKTVSPKPDSPAGKKPAVSQPAVPQPAVPQPALFPAQGSLPFTERPSAPYQGSLGVETGEGEDPCHEEQFVTLNRLRAEPDIREEETGAPEGLGLSWAGSDIVRGFVYGEILNRKKH